MHYATLALAVGLGAAGQIFLKHGAILSKEGGAFVNISVIIGLGIYLASALLYIYSIREIPLYLAFPSMSISYILVAYASHTLWGDPFGQKQIFGMLLIILGVSNLARQ